MIQRRLPLAPVLLIASVLATLLVTPVSAHDDEVASQPGGLTYHNCDEIFAFPLVRYEDARALVPERFEVARDPITGEASVLIVTHFCERVTVGGVTVANALDSYVAVALVAPEPPHPGAPPHPSFLVPGEHSGDPNDRGLTRVEGYLLQWVTNSQPHATWLEQRGLATRVRVVPGLLFDNNPFPGPDIPGAVDPSFELSVPAPAPSPFHIAARRAEPGPEIWDAGVNLWADVGERTAILYIEHHRRADQRFGPAEGAITSDDPSSPLGQLFAERQTRPLNDPVTVAFSSGAFTDGQLTSCVRSAAEPCSPAPGDHEG